MYYKININYKVVEETRSELSIFEKKFHSKKRYIIFYFNFE